MSLTLAMASTALTLGVAGGPHCAAMCGAACAGVIRAGGPFAARSIGAFQVGRLIGYMVAGAMVAGAMQSLAWLSVQSAALRPIWMVLHLGVLTWGLALLVLARQPRWALQAGLVFWRRVHPLVKRRGGVFGAGAVWVFMPCGLLYSALLVAALSGGPIEGALSMALFAVGSSLGLIAGPVWLAHIGVAGNRLRQDAGTRVSGALLAAAAVFALWQDLSERIALWCA
jgi:sulfite exporter TauE/SafE